MRVYFRQKDIPKIVLIVGVLVIAVFACVNQTWKYEEIENLVARSQDKQIVIAWDNYKGRENDIVQLTISSETEETIIELPGNAEEYIYAEGKHGDRIQVTLQLYKNGQVLETLNSSALFLDYGQMAGIPLISIDTLTGKDPTADGEEAPEGLLGWTLTEKEELESQVSIFQEGITTEYGAATIRVRGNSSAAAEKNHIRSN